MSSRKKTITVSSPTIDARMETTVSATKTTPIAAKTKTSAEETKKMDSDKNSSTSNNEKGPKETTKTTDDNESKIGTSSPVEIVTNENKETVEDENVETEEENVEVNGREEETVHKNKEKDRNEDFTNKDTRIIVAAESETSKTEVDNNNSTKIRITQIRGRKSIKEYAKDTTVTTQESENEVLKDVQENDKDIDDKRAKSTSSPTKDTKCSKDMNIEDEVLESTKEKDKDTEDLKTKPETIKELNNETHADTTCVTRLTRKTASQELLSNTRVTRNRNTSVGRPDTPTDTNSRSRRSLTRKFAAGAVNTADSSTTVKRKRASEETSSIDTSNKQIKLEVKDDVDEEEIETDVEITKIKTEPTESDELATVTSAVSRGRPRGRKSQTPTVASAAAVSPSTRTTRHTKLTSQSPSPSPTTNICVSETKRKRVVPVSAAIRGTVSLLKSNQTKHSPDEDSKDSMQSSLDEVSLTSEVRMEKMSDVEMECDSEEKKIEVEPLSVDTAVLEVASTSTARRSSSGSEKADSLSPDLISEGVNIISVKQFYKKPEFLANNLGIEEDPKLGEIVQQVESSTVEQKQKTELDGADEKYVPLSAESSAKTVEIVTEKQIVEIGDVYDAQDEEDDEDGECCERLIIEEEEDDIVLEEALDVALVDDVEETKIKNMKKTKIECDNVEEQLEMGVDIEEDNEEVSDKKRTRKSTNTTNNSKKLKKEQQQSSDETTEMLKPIDIDIKKLKKQISPVEDNKENITETMVQMDLDQEQIMKNLEQQNDYKTEEEKSTKLENIKASQTSSTSTSPAKSVQSTNSWSTTDGEYDEETLRQKEQHLKNLGLLTHKAAEKRRQEYIQCAAAAAVEAETAAATAAAVAIVEGNTHRSNSKRNGKATVVTISGEYTGTLKTVIKLNRSSGAAAAGTASTSNGSGRKNQLHHAGKNLIDCGVRRQPLKMTFQKGRGRGFNTTDRSSDSHTHGEDSYYTIQNENEGGIKTTNSLASNTNLYPHGRKSNNRSNHSLAGHTNQNLNTTTYNTKTGVFKKATFKKIVLRNLDK